MSIIL
jgi:charged multivesicular body protein 1